MYNKDKFIGTCSKVTGVILAQGMNQDDKTFISQ